MEPLSYILWLRTEQILDEKSEKKNEIAIDFIKSFTAKIKLIFKLMIV